MLPKIEIRAFGTLQVVRDTHAVSEGDWHTRQARQLLKILITERPRPVSTDRLIEILWPNSTPSAAATTLRSAINALRNVLEPDRPNRAPSSYIITQTPGYAFHLHSDIWLDVEAFEDDLDRAHHVTDPAERRHRLEAAVALYRDDYLISDPYADWAQNERERLRERYFAALMELSELHAASGQYGEAITACRRILARDEVRENAYQLLMRFQAESGDSASALLTFERCRTVLAEELGADPSPLTQMLHRRILNGEIAPSSADGYSYLRAGVESATAVSGGAAKSADAQTQPPELPPKALLPILDGHFVDAFIGRDDEVAELQGRLAACLAGRGELVVMDGEAGVGKTRLAYAILRQAAEQDATVISASCQALELKFPFAPLADSIGRYLRTLPGDVLSALPHAGLSQLAQIIPSLQDQVPELDLPADAGNLDENRHRLIEGVVTLLADLADLRPLVYFIDDLHWADQDTLAVLSRLSQRIAELPIFLILAYRSDDLVENEALITLLHAFRRTQQHQQIRVNRFSREQVGSYIEQFGHQISQETTRRNSDELTDFLYEATQGNPLFVTEALRDLQERFQDALSGDVGAVTDTWSNKYRQVLSLRHNERVREIILERIDRLPQDARRLLQLCAVIGRDFSLELLELAAETDPLRDLEILLQRKFLIERTDERLDFSHQVVRQTVYDQMNSLQRRRLHRRVGDALVQHGKAQINPAETVFHYGSAGKSARRLFEHYSVLAGENLLRTFGFRQAIEHFDNALTSLESMEEGAADVDGQLVGRALQGRGLAYEALLDPDGVTDSYRRLQNWARSQDNISLMLTVHSRLASILELVGQQRESNELLAELIEALTGEDVAMRSATITDLLERRQRIYSLDSDDTPEEWQMFDPPPPMPADPVADVLRLLEPVHAVLPLLDYGWTLRVQGQLQEAARCLEAALKLAEETGQRSLASIAYFQLAVTARMEGDLERSQLLNEESMALNRAGLDSASELVSMWPRIASAYQSLHAGRTDEADRRLQRVVDYLDNSNSFRNHRNSAKIGLGIVALARGERREAAHLIQAALADSVNLYPYTHVQAILGLARIAHDEGAVADSTRLLQKALRFAGRRSLIEEYVEVLVTISRLNPPAAPLGALLRTTLDYVTAVGMQASIPQLQEALENANLATAEQDRAIMARLLADEG